VPQELLFVGMWFFFNTTCRTQTGTYRPFICQLDIDVHLPPYRQLITALATRPSSQTAQAGAGAIEAMSKSEVIKEK